MTEVYNKGRISTSVAAGGYGWQFMVEAGTLTSVALSVTILCAAWLGY